MGLGRAYGEGLNTTNWLIQGYSVPWSSSWKKASVPPNMPFYSGDGQKGILANDIFGVITPNAPSIGSLG